MAYRRGEVGDEATVGRGRNRRWGILLAEQLPIRVEVAFGRIGPGPQISVGIGRLDRKDGNRLSVRVGIALLAGESLERLPQRRNILARLIQEPQHMVKGPIL